MADTIVVAENPNVIVLEDGKKVELRTHFPAKEMWPLMQRWAKLNEAEGFDEMAKVLATMVKSWDLPGDPHASESYGNQDMFKVILPIMKRVGEILQGAAGTEAKN